MRPVWFLLNCAGSAIVLVVVAIILLGCANKETIKPVVNVVCPQPAAAALSPSETLAIVPEHPDQNPDIALGQYGEALVRDNAVYAREVDKRETLIDHGVRFCGWTR